MSVRTRLLQAEQKMTAAYIERSVQSVFHLSFDLINNNVHHFLKDQRCRFSILQSPFCATLHALHSFYHFQPDTTRPRHHSYAAFRNGELAAWNPTGLS